MTNTPGSSAFAFLGAGLLLAGCAPRDSQTAGSDTVATVAAVTAAPSDSALLAAATFEPSLGVDLAAMTRTPGGAYVRDLVEGRGATADSGDPVSVYYRGQLPNGVEFDANGAAPRPPFTFRLFNGEVVRGFDEGIKGMKVGGRRLVVMPPSLGYGAAGSGPVPPNAIMVFTITLADTR